jgi:integrase
MAGKNIIKEPKSKAGRRTISIPSHVIGAVADHLDLYVDGSLDAFVITASNRRLSAAWSQARTSVGRSDLRFHDLRHSGLTWAATAGATVSELMNRAGHATMESSIRYQHATADRDRHIADSLTELARLSGSDVSWT